MNVRQGARRRPCKREMSTRRLILAHVELQHGDEQTSASLPPVRDDYMCDESSFVKQKHREGIAGTPPLREKRSPKERGSRRDARGARGRLVTRETTRLRSAHSKAPLAAWFVRAVAKVSPGRDETRTSERGRGSANSCQGSKSRSRPSSGRAPSRRRGVRGTPRGESVEAPAAVLDRVKPGAWLVALRSSDKGSERRAALAASAAG